MGFGADECEVLDIASRMHDIGKLSVPAEILSKPSRLSSVEFSLIKMHCQAGHDIVSSIEFPKHVATIVLQHHERLDGSGYPQGLADSEILLESCIVGIADVVEAMVSHRPYRVAHSLEAARAEIKANRGTLYLPEAVDACLRLLENGYSFADRHPTPFSSPAP